MGAVGHLAQHAGGFNVQAQNRDFYLGAAVGSAVTGGVGTGAATGCSGATVALLASRAGAPGAVAAYGGALVAMSAVAGVTYAAMAASASSGSGGEGKASEKTEHAQQRGDEAKAGDTHRQVGDPNRTVQEGRSFTDSKTGNTVHVRGKKVFVTSADGKQVTQFKNTRVNTQDRIKSGPWVSNENK